MNTDAYLKRIKLDKVTKLDLATLTQLQINHMLHVPFENLDVIRNVEIPLDVQTYYRKIVTNHRGGFCYELNGLFHWLLQSLGYDASLISATVSRGDGTWTMEGSHAAIIVQLDQPYFVDVGFGDSVRSPLPLTGETSQDVSGTYRIAVIEAGYYDLQQKNSGEDGSGDEGDDNASDDTGVGTGDTWRTRNRFTTNVRQLGDFKEACHFNQTSPESNFTKRELATIATEDGRVTFSDNKLIRTRFDEKEETPVSADEKARVLKQYFGLELE